MFIIRKTTSIKCLWAKSDEKVYDDYVDEEEEKEDEEDGDNEEQNTNKYNTHSRVHKSTDRYWTRGADDEPPAIVMMMVAVDPSFIKTYAK